MYMPGLNTFVLVLSLNFAMQVWADDTREQSSATAIKPAQFSAQQREAMQKFQQRWSSLTPAQRRSFDDPAAKWSSLPPADQARIRDAMNQWRALSEERKARIRQAYEEYQTLSTEDKARANAGFGEYRKLSPAQRLEFRERWKKLGASEPAGQEKQERH